MMQRQQRGEEPVLMTLPIGYLAAPNNDVIADQMQGLEKYSSEI